MIETAAAQLRRVLHVIPELADEKEHSLAEIAGRIGVDEATLRRDLWSIVTRFQEPGGFVQGVQLYMVADRVSLVSNHFRRPMRLTSAELCALELGLAMLRLERPPDEHRAIDGARARLREVIVKLPGDTPATDSYHAAVGAALDPGHLAAVRRALRGRRKLRLTYRRGGATESSHRTIAPYALVVASGTFYVVAYCERGEGLRVFRMDRVEGAEVTEERFAVPRDFSLDAVLQDGRAFHAEQPRTMRVRYSPRIARWIAERLGGEPGEDGALVAEHPVADDDWALRHVLQYGPDAEILEPEQLRAAARDRLRTMMADAEGPGAQGPGR